MNRIANLSNYSVESFDARIKELFVAESGTQTNIANAAVLFAEAVANNVYLGDVKVLQKRVYKLRPGAEGSDSFDVQASKFGRAANVALMWNKTGLPVVQDALEITGDYNSFLKIMSGVKRDFKGRKDKPSEAELKAYLDAAPKRDPAIADLAATVSTAFIKLIEALTNNGTPNMTVLTAFETFDTVANTFGETTKDRLAREAKEKAKSVAVNEIARLKALAAS